MRIVQIIPTLGQGGAERFVVDLSNKLSELGHSVLLIQLFPETKRYSFYRSEIAPSVQYVSLGKKLGFDFAVLFKLNCMIVRFKPDVVHTHLEGISYIIPSLCMGAKFVHTIHNQADKEAAGMARRIRSFLFKHKLVCPITISDSSEQSFREIYGQNGNTIFNGRNFDIQSIKADLVHDEIESYKLSKDTKVLMLLARLSKQKRPYILAKVAKKLIAQGYDITVLLIGADQDDFEKNKILDINCPNLHILGERSNPMDYLKDTFAFCLCSEYEGLPISLIEAMHSGAIPVCTPVGGIVDLVKDGFNGILSKDISEESYYYALKRLLDTDEAAVHIMKDKTKESVEIYNMNYCAKNYIEFYKS